jgi:hypothetical protein
MKPGSNIVVGASPTPSEKAASAADVAALQATKDKIHTQAYQQDLKTRSAQADLLVGLVNKVSPDAFLEGRGKFADLLNAVTGGAVGQQDASDIRTYKRLLDVGAMGNRGMFPGRVTNLDVGFLKSMMGSATSPRDAAALVAATQAATIDNERAFSKFVDENAGLSNDELFAKWSKGPGGQSLFSSPRFKDVNFDGKPIAYVSKTINPKTGKPDILLLPGSKKPIHVTQ